MKQGGDGLHLFTRSLALALGLRDRLTQLHSERVRVLSECIAVRLGLPEADMVTLRFAASFHDVGKIGVPDQVLLKPGALDAQEWEVMKGHAGMGASIIAETGLAGASDAARAIRHHHEHFDGGGYPDGLAGAAIPLCARIISVADSYDAMAETRPYHPVRAHDEIMAVLERETGSKHDPEVMAVFRALIASGVWKVTPGRG